MKYNIFIKTQHKSYNILDINKVDLKRVIDTYNHGNPSVFIQGEKCIFSNLSEIQIYTFEHEILKSKRDLLNYCYKNKLTKHIPMLGEWIPHDNLENFGMRVTGDYLNGNFGDVKEVTKTIIPNDFYVEQSRIFEIEAIRNVNFDFTKLVQLLKEMNIAHSNKLLLTIPILVRTVIDHIPPVFSKQNFKEVCGSYGSRSFKESMINLEKSNRKIADSILHQSIRRKESLPTKTQIDFKNDLDVLLQEIVRINKFI